MQTVYVAGGNLNTSPAAASLTESLKLDLTTTRYTFSFASGAKWMLLSYRNLPGSTAVTGQYAKLVFNCTTDAEANGKLVTEGAYTTLCQGDDLELSSLDGITRVDVISVVAVGAEKTLFRILAGV